MIEQRNVWRRFELAPEDIPDPFGQQWWTLMQVLAWVYRRDPAVVRLVAPPEPFETTFTIKDLRVLGRNGACYPRIENAGDAVIEALQAGRLTATGFLDGEGDRNEIPPLSWVDLVFRFEPYYFAGPKDPSRTVPYWNDLRFQRKDVLAVWPDSLESPAMADEQKTSTTAEGKERPVQRRARITARHQGLKAAGDPHPTKTIAEEEGISRRRVLQVMENKPKANEAPPTRPIPKAR